MKKRRTNFSKLLARPAHPLTLTRQLAEALDANARMREQVAAHDREEGRLANENTRLGKIIEELKENLFNKSLALAHLEGQLQRVDHEDAERAEVVQVQDMQLTRLSHSSGNDMAGPPVPIQKSVLKYELARLSQPKQVMQSTDFTNYEEPSTVEDWRRNPRPKHWVNRY